MQSSLVTVKASLCRRLRASGPLAAFRATLLESALSVIAPTSIILTRALDFVLISATNDLVKEKESNMRAVQEVHGLTPILYWLSFAAHSLINSAAATAGVLAVLFVWHLRKAEPTITAVLFLAAYLQHLFLAAVISAFFKRTSTAHVVTTRTSLLLLLCSEGIQRLSDGADLSWYVGALLPPFAFQQGLATTQLLETHFVCGSRSCVRGLSQVTVWAVEVCPQARLRCQEPVKVFPVGHSISLLALSIILYAALAWWLDHAWRGEYGMRPWYPWRVRGGMVPLLAHGGGGRAVTLSIVRLRKVFGMKVAVDDLSLDFYSYEIFALLGHNGAGKTTAMNCILGLTSPTNGGANVNGFDVGLQLEDARRQLGFCPQDSPIFPDFTVRQHLTHFAGLRGLPQQSIPERTNEVLRELGMVVRVDELCCSLSGGLKRRLWVATALLHEAPVLFLDEPSSGVDPSSRRDLWNVLLQRRTAGRTVIFTTHYLDEADVLADRKAVMVRGAVQACGTSRELKVSFGAGYHLTLSFHPFTGEDKIQASECLVQQHVAAAKDDATHKEEEALHAEERERYLHFLVPFQEVNGIGPLLLSIEANREELQVKDFSLTMTSLEEIFMRLGREGPVDFADPGGEVDEIASVDDATAHIEVTFQRAMLAMARLRLELMKTDSRLLLGPYISVLVACFVCSSHEDLIGGLQPAFVTTTLHFAMQVHFERDFKIKHTAIAQGLGYAQYWLGTAMANYLSLVPVVLAAVSAMLLLHAPEVVPAGGLVLVSVMTLIFPAGLVLLCYNLSVLCYEWILYSTIILGCVPMVVLQLLALEMVESAQKLHVAMSFLNPMYGLPGTLLFLQRTESTGVLDVFSSWSALPMFASLLLYPLLLANLVYMDKRARTARPGPASIGVAEGKDDDVLAEEQRMMWPGLDASEAVCYRDFMHTYRTKVNRKWVDSPAVRGVSLGIQRGECFGLLGPNGAGKTTTLAALTGEVRPPSAGRLLVCGHDLASPCGLDAAYQRLGVCPQVDPLWARLSGRQHLSFYGRVKGVPERELEKQVAAWLSRLGFDRSDFGRSAEEYSGGMKRKLSLACALIGQPEVLFLDEPTAAVDASGKRHLWRVIKRRRCGQTAVVTTHAMEEAEALCSRVAIQVNGQLRCLGSPRYLKQKYASGYQLEIFNHLQTSSGPADKIVDFVHAKITSEAVLIEYNAGRYLFQLPPMGRSSSLSLGRVFTEMSQSSAAVGVSDFSIGQPSLEQVFLRLAGEQRED